MTAPLGLYIHVPFCRSKCPYCDFYSLVPTDEALLDAYTACVCDALRRWGTGEPADTLYFGGGTPSLLGGARLAAIVEAARTAFSLADGSEITLEANPADDLYDTLAAFAAAGGNRLSLGMQSAHDVELQLLGRRHVPRDVARTLGDARAVGIQNISLDIMLGIAAQTDATALSSVEEAVACGVPHVSAYMLKIEEGTPYAAAPPIGLADEDALADRYFAVCEALETAGLAQYEISNFARPGFESRHNSKYWDLTPYLGIGPAAHSFYGGKRFFYRRDLGGFLRGDAPVDDSGLPCGGPDEYIMLRLRTAAGLRLTDFSARYGVPLPESVRAAAAQLPRTMVISDDDGIRLTREGFAVSNAVIARLLEAL